MDIMRRPFDQPTALRWAVILAAAIVVALASPAVADIDEPTEAAVTLAVGEHERRPIAPTQRDQLGLVLYGFMAVVTVVGIATMRRQLRGERPQSDGEFRWR